MNRTFFALLLTAIAAVNETSGAFSQESLVSVAKPATQTNPSVTKPGAAPVSPLKQTAAPTETTATPSASAGSASSAADPAAAHPTGSQALAQAYAIYKSNPSPATFGEFLRIFKHVVNEPAAQKAPAAAIIKGNFALQDIGVKVIDAGAGRVWTFPRIPFNQEIVLQWADTKATTTFVGRRRRYRRVTYSTTWHTQSLFLPQGVRVKEARVAGGPSGARWLTLVGDQNGATLWLNAYRMTGGVWKESPGQFSTIPSFLTHNVSGRVTFRGSDLIFLVARLTNTPNEYGAPLLLPESESSTYKFWLKLTENGYVWQNQLPNQASCLLVYHFLQALNQNRTDIAKQLVVDNHLVDIPRYVGLRSATAPFHVVEMSSPPSGVYRFRLVTGMKNDLIFDVGKVRDKQLKVERPMIKAIFIAPPDPFLQEIAKNLPLFDKVAEPAKPEEKPEDPRGI